MGCPKGYVEREGLVGDQGYKGQLKLSLDECAQQCNAEPKCLSFDNLPSKNNCHLNDIANPDRVAQPPWMFCMKLGSTIDLAKHYVSFKLLYHKKDLNLICIYFYVIKVRFSHHLC